MCTLLSMHPKRKKMKRIIVGIIGLLLCLNLYAQQKKEELTYNEQKELISMLEKQDKALFELGLIYEDGIIDVNNKKTPNIEKAKEYYIKAYNNKDYRAVFKLTGFLLEKKQPKKALEILENAIKYSNNPSLKTGAVTTYGTIALDYFSDNKDIIIDAIYNYNQLTKKALDDTPTSKFVKASLLATAGNVVLGEKLLNEACYSPKAPKELKQKCFDPKNFDLVKEDVKKSIDEPCCTVLEQ